MTGETFSYKNNANASYRHGVCYMVIELTVKLTKGGLIMAFIDYYKILGVDKILIKGCERGLP